MQQKHSPFWNDFGLISSERAAKHQKHATQGRLMGCGTAAIIGNANVSSGPSVKTAHSFRFR